MTVLGQSYRRFAWRVVILPLVAAVLVVSARAQAGLNIKLANSTPAEVQSKAQLERLLKTYDLSKWIVTKSIVIDEKTAIPHSHPVLTLNTRHLKDDELMVSTFVHEQMHWFVMQEGRDMDGAIAEFKKLFPTVPAKGPEGARDESSTYLHIGVCYLEYRAVRELMVELRAKQVMDFWSTDHYKWIYRTVLERPRDIGQIMFKFNLVPREPRKVTE